MDNQIQDNDVLTFSKIWTFLKKSFATSLMFALVTAIIGVIVCVSIYSTTKSTYYQNVVTFNYDGVNDGLAPNGATLNKNEIISYSVAEKAINASNLTDKVAPIKLQGMLSVKEIYPQNILNQINSLTELSKKDSKALADLEKLLNHNHPSSYQVMFYDPSNALKLTDSEINTLMGNLSTCYIEEFTRKYFMTVRTVSFDSSGFSDIDTNSVEFIDAYNRMNLSIEYNIDLLREMNKKYPTFVAPSNMKSFNDLANALEQVKVIHTNKIYDNISANTLYKNKAAEKKRVTSEVDRLTAERDSYKLIVDQTKTILDNYKGNDKIITLPDGTVVKDNDDSRYFKLVEDQQNNLKLLANSELKLSTAKKQLEIITAAGTDPITEEEKAGISTAIKTASNVYQASLTEINKVLDDFYEHSRYTDSVKTLSLPAGTLRDISTKTVILGIVVAGVIGYVIGMFVYQSKAKKHAK